MHPSLASNESPKATPTGLIDAPAEPAPEWSTLEARRRRTLLFLVFSAVYIAYHLVVPPNWFKEWTEIDMLHGRGWVFQPLFNGDWYFFGGDPPPWYEYVYRWFLTLLPLAAWAGVIFFLLTRLSILTHRRVAFVIVLLGMVFFEANMRWFNMSNNHVSWNEVRAFFDLHGSSDLGLTSTAYQDIAWKIVYDVLFLGLCAFLAGPEPRLIAAALWNGPFGTVIRAFWNATFGTMLQAIWSGPLGRTYVGIGSRWLCSPTVLRRLDAGAFRALGWLDSKPAFACILVFVTIDPVVIWALDNEKNNGHGDRAVVRQIADTNPLRWHSLDRAWAQVVFLYSEEARDLAAANAALRQLDSSSISIKGNIRALPRRKAPAEAENILILQAETINGEVFYETLPDMPYLGEFSKKCVRLRRNFSVANATHYGILGLLHGSPVTFFTGPRDTHRPDPYLAHFKEHGYKTRLITRSVMGHHSLGNYLPNWTEPVSEPPGDFKCIPEIHEELAKPGPHLVYSFYHATHYPYDHDKDARFHKYLPEVDYDFNYNRSALFEWKEPILNRYKNTLLNMDDWYRDILQKVDLSKTIVIITGDHGEEFFQQGRLGHCSALNIHQTRTPCLVYIPGVAPADVTFITSNADILPTIADALGHDKKPETLGQSLFEPVSFRYAVLSHFDYTTCKVWSVATEEPGAGEDLQRGRMALFARDYWDNVELTGLKDWDGQPRTYRDDAEVWNDSLRIIRRVEREIAVSRD